MPTCVCSLLQSRCPPAIGRGIAAVVVNTVNAAIGGALAHIGKEVCKFSPPPTNGNAASAIVFVVNRVGIAAALKHVVPRSECRRVLIITSVAVSGSSSYASA